MGGNVKLFSIQLEKVILLKIFRSVELQKRGLNVLYTIFLQFITIEI